MEHEDRSIQRAVLHRLQIDNVHQVKISCVAQKRRRLLDGEHDAAGDCGARAGRRHVGEGGAARDDEAGFAWATEVGGRVAVSTVEREGLEKEINI